MQCVCLMVLVKLYLLVLGYVAVTSRIHEGELGCVYNHVCGREAECYVRPDQYVRSCTIIQL